ncbi:MAG: hypothetical protein ACREJB_00495 [Planctomycetaceae bacterium]
MNENMTRQQVQSRVSDWKKRLIQLFREIEEWAKAHPEQPEIIHSTIRQHQEYPLTQFKVPPADLPTLTLRFSNREVRFVPHALWVLGANGWVDVVEGTHATTLVDKGGKDGEPSNWQIVVSDPRINMEPFSPEMIDHLDFAAP